MVIGLPMLGRSVCRCGKLARIAADAHHVACAAAVNVRGVVRDPQRAARGAAHVADAVGACARVMIASSCAYRRADAGALRSLRLNYSHA